MAEFTRRGITEKKTSELLANLKPGQYVVAQLELGDNLVRNARIPIVNPPGFFIRLVESNTSIPESFETNAKRKAREENERQEREQRAQEDARQLLESEYDEYCRLETDRFIAENPETFEAIKETKRAENRERYQTFSPEMIETIAQNEAKREIRKQAPLLTSEEFVNRKQQGPDFSLKPVALPADAETVSAAPKPQEIAVSAEADDTAPDPPAMAGERGEAIQPAPEAATEPAMSEPAIELVSEPPRQEPGGNAAEEGMV